MKLFFLGDNLIETYIKYTYFESEDFIHQYYFSKLCKLGQICKLGHMIREELGKIQKITIIITNILPASSKSLNIFRLQLNHHVAIVVLNNLIYYL